MQSHLDAGKRAGEHQVVEIPEVTDPEHAAGELAEPVAERQVVVLQNGRAQRVGIEALRHQNRGQRARVLARVEAQELEAPGVDRPTGRLGVTIVAREHLLQPCSCSIASDSRRP